MKGRCLISFFGSKVRGTIGQIVDIPDQATFDDLIASGYLEAVESPRKKDNVSSDPETLVFKPRGKNK
jgi:hypothetical protein